LYLLLAFSLSSSGSEPYECQLWDNDEVSSSTSVDSFIHNISKLEAYLYYTGLYGSVRHGSKLIYRTLTDIFLPPSGPFQEVRERQLLTVHEHPKLSQDNLWATIRDEVCEL